MKVFKAICSICLLIFAAAGVAQSTDYQCMSDCTNSGSMHSFCKSKCSYERGYSPQADKRTDYNCQQKCTDNNYSYSYCKQACEY
jgi:hypothetical protein